MRFGVAKGLFTVPADFDSPLPPDVLASFEKDHDLSKRVLQRWADRAMAVEVALADLGGLAPDIQPVPRRRPAD